MLPVPSRRAFLAAAALAPLARAASPARRDRTRELRPDQRVTIDASPAYYCHSAGVAVAGGELVCVYRRSDEHVASRVEIWSARSRDGGRTWADHKLVSASSFAADRACWVAPQLGRLRDGRLVVIADRGVKKSAFDWPMLSQWQLPDRGMSNHLFVSGDGGRTWDGPRKVDGVGGEPSYVVELSNGSWLYTRTDSAPTGLKKNPSMPWGANYYKSTAVFSDDGGATFSRTAKLADDPLVGDCEVGVAEYAPGRLVAVTRVGDGGSAFGQPSRFVFSDDFGKTWGEPVLAPVYATPTGRASNRWRPVDSSSPTATVGGRRPRTGSCSTRPSGSPTSPTRSCGTSRAAGSPAA